MRRAWSPALLLGLLLLGLMLLAAAVPDVLAPYDPLVFDFAHLSAPPSSLHPFGTDQFGRDILSRTIHAARIDLQIAVFCMIFPLWSGVS